MNFIIYFKGKSYAFDNVFQPNDTQEHVYKGAAHHIVQDVGFYVLTKLFNILIKFIFFIMLNQSK